MKIVSKHQKQLGKKKTSAIHVPACLINRSEPLALEMKCIKPKFCLNLYTIQVSVMRVTNNYGVVIKGDVIKMYRCNTIIQYLYTRPDACQLQSGLT